MLVVIWAQRYDVFHVKLQTQTKQKPTDAKQLNKCEQSNNFSTCAKPKIFISASKVAFTRSFLFKSASKGTFIRCFQNFRASLSTSTARCENFLSHIP